MYRFKNALLKAVALLAGQMAVSSMVLLHGLTYYVDSNNGSDANDGSSPASSWKTLAKVNGGSFNPGDTILFARGREWHESLAASSDGSNSNPIVYDAYGTGANPKFWGSDVLVNSNFTDLGGGVYEYNLGQTANALFVNHTFVNDTAGRSLTANGQWTMVSGTTLELESATDPRTDGNVYSVSLRDDVVLASGRNHLVFRSIDADESARSEQGIHAGYAFRVQNSTDVKIQNCNAYRAGKHHFASINSTGFIGSNLSAAYAQPGYGYGGASALVSYGDTSTGLTNQTSVWQNVSVSHMEDLKTPGIIYEAIATHGATLGSVTIDNLISNGAAVDLNNGENTSAVLKLTNSTIQNSPAPGLMLYGDGILVDGLKITGATGSAELIGSNMVLQNVLISGTNLGSTPWNAALISGGNNNILRFSTIDAGNSNAIALQNDDTSFSFYGNILFSSSEAIRQWNGGFSTASIANADYNLYRSYPTFAALNASNQGSRYSFEQWQALGLDAHAGTADDPVFANRSLGDYTLQAASPAINAAALSTSLLSSVPYDLAGNPRLVDVAFDMGAYEYQTAVGTGLHSFPGTINAQNVNTGGAGVGYSGATPFSGGLGLSSSGDWANYDVDVSTTDKYYLTALTATGANNESIRFLVDGQNVTGDLRVPNTGSWSTFAPITAENIELSAGTHVVQVYTASGGLTLQSFSFAISLPGIMPALNIMPGGEGVSYHNILTSGEGVGFSDAGEWAKYAVHVSATGKYYLTALTATGEDQDSIKFLLDGVDVTGDIPAPNTGSWSTFGSATAENVEIFAGDHVVEAYSSSGGLSFESFSLTTSVPGTVQANSVILGGEGTGYHGASIMPTGTGFAAAGDWTKYNIHVSATGKYFLTALTATGADNEHIKFLVDGLDVTGDLAATNTGSWETYAPTSAENIELTAGNHVVEAYTPSGGLNLQSFSFTTSVPGTVQTSNVNLGGEGIGYHGALITPTTIGFANAGQWAKYNIHASAAGNYDVSGSTATGVNNESIKFLIDGVGVTGDLAAPNTGTWEVYTRSATATISLSAGDHVVELYTSSGGLNVQSFTFTRSLPGAVQASNVNLGGEGVGYHGVSINPAEVAFTNGGYWTKYSVDISATGTYDFSASVRTGVNNEKLNFLVDGVDVTGELAIPNTDWNTYGTVTKTGVSLSAGPHVIEVFTSTGGFFMNQFNVTAE